MGLSIWRKTLNTLQIQNDYSEKPAGFQWRSNTLFILSTVGVGLFSDLFLYALILPVLPFMLEDRIGVPNGQVQSYTSALLAVYAGSSVAFSVPSGILADRMSTRQAPFLFGLAALVGATVLLFLGRTMPVLVVARILQGVSSGFVWTVGLAMCIEIVGPAKLGTTIGVMFSFVSVGSLWAPFLGGLLYKQTGISGVMAVALAILGVDFLMRIFVIEKKVAQRYNAESLSRENGDCNTSNNQQSANQNDETSNDEEQPLLGRHDEDETDFELPPGKSKLVQLIPILPCLKHPGLLAALWLAFVQALLLGSLDATVAIVSRELFGFDSLKAGLLFFPLGVLDLIFGPIAGWGVDRYGTKPVSIISYVFLTPVLVLLRLPRAGGMDQAILYGALLGVLGIGLSGTGAPSIVESGAVVDKYHKANPDFFGESGPYASLYGMNNMMFNLGLTIGPELAGELKQAIGYGNMNIVLAVLCAITAILSFFYVGGKPRVLRKRKL